MTGSRRSAARSAPHRVRLRIEALEDRRLLSAVPTGAEFQVNTHTTGNQWFSAVAMDADGGYVVAWQSDGQDGDGWGIYAQRYHAAGVAQGGEFQVNTYTTGDQSGAAVAMDADGDFVVAWQSVAQDGDGSGIYAQRYDSLGVPQGGEFQINAYTTGDQTGAAVAMDADGDFVVAWESYAQDGDDYGIYARRYDAAGVAQGGDFQVNTHTTGDQRDAAVAIAADGDFVVAWSSDAQDGSDYGVFAQRYDAAGAGQGAEFQVNSYTTGSQELPSVGLDADGDFVVAWQSDGQDGGDEGVYAQRYDSAGAAQGSEFRVHAHTTTGQRSPRVAIGAGGEFVVAWFSSSADASGFGVSARSFDAAGEQQGNEFQVNTYSTNSQSTPSVAIDSDGDFVVTWTSGDNQDGQFYGIYAQRYVGTLSGPELQVNTYTTLRQRSASVAIAADGDFVVAWSSDAQDGSDYGVYAQRYDAAGVPQGGEFQVNTYTTGAQSFASVAIDADGDFVVAWQSDGQDGSSDGVFAQRYDAAGVPQGGEFQVNTYTTSFQRFPSVAMDTDGDFVVAWESFNQEGSGDEVYARRYSATGVAQGGEFRVNTYTTGFQDDPSVAMGADGRFIVAWESFVQDGSSYGVYAQRYDAAGVAQGSEFQVNTYTTDNQRFPDVAIDADGDFVVTWESNDQDGSSYGVYAQRYNAAGVPQESEFQVNVRTTFSQRDPRVAVDAHGGFVVAWESNGQDGSGFGVYSRRYSAAGVAQGGEFQVNTYTTDIQLDPSVAMVADGDFVVAWTSDGQDGDNYGVYAQRFENAPSSVTGRRIFYNESTYDDNSPGIDPADSSAVAPDKSAYRPGDGTITSASMTSYSRGLNGIFVDLTGAHGVLGLADFSFKVSNTGSGPAGANNTPSTWSTAPAPTAFTVLPDTPSAGTDRVEFIWANNAIQNQYLQVVVEGDDAAGGFNTNTGLASSDVFYFGNIIGDTFDDVSPTVWLTTAADETAIQTQIITEAPITSIWDMDRNGVHLASDRIVTRANTITTLNRINIMSAGSVYLAHADGSQTSYPAAADTDVARGIALRDAATAAIAGDTLLLGPGTFNIDAAGEFLNIPGGVTVRGAGIDVTTIETNLNSHDVTGATAVRLGGSNILLEDLTIHGTRNDGSYQMPLGPSTTNVNDIVLRRIKIYAPDTSDGFYSWGPGSSSFYLYDTQIITGYDTLVTLSSNSGDFVYAENSYFESTGALWRGNPNGIANNIVNKAGSHTYVNSRFKTRNDASGNTQTFGVWNLLDIAVTTCINCEFDVSASDGLVFDLYRPEDGTGGFVISGGSGSGPDGEITTSGGNVTYAAPSGGRPLSALSAQIEQTDRRSPRPIPDIDDHNEDGLLSAADQIAAHANIRSRIPIDVANPPAAPEASPNNAAAQPGALSAMASALAIPDDVDPPDAPHSASLPTPAIDSGGRVNPSPIPPPEQPDDPRAGVLFEAADDAGAQFEVDEAVLELLAAERR